MARSSIRPTSAASPHPLVSAVSLLVGIISRLTRTSLVRFAAGWTEALQLMVVGECSGNAALVILFLVLLTGDVWELTIPSNLGYGSRGTGRDIGEHTPPCFLAD